MTDVQTTPETVQVCPATRKVGKLLADLVVEAKKLVANGQVSFVELPEVFAVIMRDVLPAVSEFKSVVTEVTGDPSDEIVTAALVGSDIVKALKK